MKNSAKVAVYEIAILAKSANFTINQDKNRSNVQPP